jgi:hypothetical protein
MFVDTLCLWYCTSSAGGRTRTGRCWKRVEHMEGGMRPFRPMFVYNYVGIEYRGIRFQRFQHCKVSSQVSPITGTATCNQNHCQWQCGTAHWHCRLPVGAGARWGG